jgi:hypothetical protein
VQWIINKIGGRLRKKEEIEEQRCANLDVIKYASGVLLFLTVSKIEHLSSICLVNSIKSLEAYFPCYHYNLPPVTSQTIIDLVFDSLSVYKTPFMRLQK